MARFRTRLVAALLSSVLIPASSHAALPPLSAGWQGQLGSIGHYVVRAADLNSDGIADVVSQANDANQLHIWLGRADGTFAAPRIQANAIPFWAFELVDLDNDGKRDILTSDGALVVMKGDGLGGFGAAQHFGPDVAGAEFALAVADLDGDLKADAVDVTGSSLRFWKGVGNGTFLAPVSTTVTGAVNLQGVAIGDIDNDGKLDLLLATTTAQFTLKGVGNGSFTDWTNFPISSFSSPHLADFDQDGVLDVALDNGACRRGLGDGTFGATLFTIDFAIQAVSDLDLDGYPDLLGLGDVSRVVTRMNDHHGGMRPALSSRTSWSPIAAIAFDANRDGFGDLLFSTYGSANIGVLLGRGGGLFGSLNAAPLSRRPVSPVADPLPGGPDRMVYARSDSLALEIVQRQSNGTIVHVADLTSALDVRHIVRADADGDGTADLVTADGNGGTVSVYRGLGAGLYAPRVAYSVGVSGVARVAVFEASGDARPDLVALVRGATTGSLHVLAGLAGGGYAAPTTLAIAAGAPLEMAVADFNQDGRTDAIVRLASNNSTLLIYRGQVGGDFLASSVSRFLGGGSSRGIVAGFADDDAFPDLLTYSDASCAVIRGSAALTLTVIDTLTLTATANALLPGDLDLDGHNDIVLLRSKAGGASLWSGTGTGQFNLTAEFGTASNPVAVGSGDFNGDGGADLVVVGQSVASPPADNELVVHLGRATPPVDVEPAPASTARDLAFRLVSANPSVHGVIRCRFQLPDATPARVELLDLQGRRIASASTSGVGVHDVSFARPRAPGVYLARLHWASEMRSVRVTVLK